MRHLRKKLPGQFDDATTNRTIELIDVLWLHADAIATFKVKHTSAIYSGHAQDVGSG
ncbi:MAG: hypothetical protein LUQ44_02780 [Methanothrix sp.]|nr:hypothetical protein [Methanothrix sp.]